MRAYAELPHPPPPGGIVLGEYRPKSFLNARTGSLLMPLFLPFIYFTFLSSYHPPAGTDVEQVVVREMPHPNDPVKNLIICMSDLHLDSQWSEGVMERLATFMEQLEIMAKVTILVYKVANLF